MRRMVVPILLSSIRRARPHRDLVGVAALDDNAAMRVFVSATGLDEMDHIDDSSLEIWMRFGIKGQPSWALVNDDGSTEIHR